MPGRLSRRVALLATAPLVLGIVLIAPSPALAAPTPLVANLSGAAEVPDPGDPDGAGSAFLVVDPDAGTICPVLIEFVGIAEPTLAHIHEGAATVAGPVVVDLFDTPSPDGFIENCLDNLDTALLQDIVANPADYYVNVHNDEFPDGAIRGQLGVPPPTFFTELSGEAEVPGPGDPDGVGDASIGIEVDAGRACYFISVMNIGMATAAHVHEGGPAVAGPIVITLDPPGPDGFVEGCVEGVDGAVLQAIVDDPGGYYLNVHTADYPDGAVRGQLSTEPPPPPECTPPALCDGLAVPGSYQYGGFAASLSFALVESWFAFLAPDGFGLNSVDLPGAFYAFEVHPDVYTGACGATPGQIAVSPQAFADFLTTHPNISVVSAPQDVTLGGASGLVFEVTGTGTAACPAGFARLFTSEPPAGLPPDAADFIIVDGERIRFWALDVAGQTVFVAVDAFEGAVFDELLGDAQSILNSMAFAIPQATPTPTATPSATPTAATSGTAAPTPTPREAVRGLLPNTASPLEPTSSIPMELLFGAVVAGTAGVMVLRRRSARR
jgi:hypothetical protein